MINEFVNDSDNLCVNKNSVDKTIIDTKSKLDLLSNDRNHIQITRKEDIYQIDDVISNIDNSSNLSNLELNKKNRNSELFTELTRIDYLESTSSSMIKTIFSYIKTTNPLQWIFLIFFSITITIICFIFDFILTYGLHLRLSVCNSQNTFLGLIIWVSTGFILLLMATSVGYFISSDADGSGIPELKTVISGININRYFSIEAFIAKVTGLFCALLGGKFNM